jgi:excinuclease ABC subunit C
LFLIDGGKGQLKAAIRARDSLGFDTPMIGLAKKEEQIVVCEQSNANFLDIESVAKKFQALISKSEEFKLIDLPDSNDVVKLLQRIRDESHRFAVSYHSTLKRNRQTASWLDEVPGVGPATKRKLIRLFGSARGVSLARKDELIQVLGEKQATIVSQYIRANKKAD